MELVPVLRLFHNVTGTCPFTMIIHATGDVSPRLGLLQRKRGVPLSLPDTQSTHYNHG